MAKGLIANFLVNISSKGLGKTKAGIDGLAKSTTHVGKSYDVASRAAGAHFDMQSKGVIGTANSTKSFSKLAQTMNSGGGVVGAYATLAANVFAVSAAFNALRGASQAEQVLRGLEAAGTRTGRTLTVTAKALKDVTDGALSTEQSMRSTSQVIAAGFKSDAVVKLGQAARDTSFALGRNLQDSMDRLTRGVVKLEPELLDELGIMTKLGESNANYARQLGKTEAQLSNFERRQGFMNAVLAEAELKFGGLSEAAGDSTAYDKLLARLKDLTNTILNFINKAIIPLVNLFGGNSAGLAGMALLFAGTIRSQLLPGLVDLSKGAVAASDELSKVAKAQAAAVADLNPKSRNKNSVVLRDLNKEIAKGTATIEQQTTAYNISRNSVKKFNEELESGTKLTDKRRNFITSEIEVHESYQDVLRRSINTEVSAMAQRQKGDAIMAASANQYGTAMGLMITASKNYYNSSLAAASGSGIFTKSLTVLRTTAFAAAGAVRILGAALLNAIPAIGQVLFVVGLLATAWNSIKSDKQKELEKSTRDLLEITSAASEKQKEFNRLNETSASIASRTKAQIILQANALSELAQKFEEVDKAAKKSADGRGARGSAKWYDMLAARTFGTVNHERADQNINILEASRRGKFDQDFELARTLIGKDNSEVTQSAANQIATLEAMSKIAPQIYSRILELHGGVEGLSKLDQAQRESKFAEMIREIGSAAEGVASMIEDLSESLKVLDQELADFMRAGTKKTPFDGIVAGTQRSIVNFRELNLAIAQGKDVADDWSNILLGMGDNLRSMMPPTLVDDINKVNDASKEVSRVMSIDAGKRTEADKASLVAAQQVLRTRSQVTQAVQQQVQAMERDFVLAQQQDILLQGILKSEQTRLQIHARDFAITGEGVKARIAGENKLKDLEIARLQVQIKINEAAIMQKRVWIETQEQIINSQKLLKDYNAEQLTAGLALRTDILATQRQEYNRASTSEARKAELLNEIALSNSVVSILSEQISARNAIVDTNNSIALQEATITSLQQEAANLAQLRTTAAEAQAEAASVEVQRRTEILSLLRAQRAIAQNAADNEVKQQALLRGRTNALRTQLELVERTRDRELVGAREARDAQLDQINVDRKLAAARVSGDAEAEASVIRHYNTLESIANQGLVTKEAEVNSTAELARLELIVFDTRKEGLEWQKEALSMVEKQIDAQQTLVQAIEKQRNATQDLSLRRRGLTLSQEGTEAREIRAAQVAYELARDQVSIKKAMIDLEFALLDAQRELLAEQLSERRQALAEDNTDGRFNNRLAQLDQTISTLTNIDTSRVAQAYKQALDVEVESARTELQVLSRSASSIGVDVISRLEGREARIRAREAARISAATRAANDNIQIVRPAPEVAAEERRANTLVSSNTDLIATIDRWITTIETAITKDSGTIRTSIPNARTAASLLGTELNARGLRANEHPDHGGVTPGAHRGRGHAEGRALDINVNPRAGETNIDADNPRMARILDNLKRELETKYGEGVKILWRTAGHYNHMHVEFVRGFTQQMEVLETISRATADQVTAKVDDVIVTGQRREVLDPVARSTVTPLTLRAPEIADPAKLARDKVIAEAQDALDAFNILSEGIVANLAQLGPDGEVLMNAISGISLISSHILKAAQEFNSPEADFASKFQAGAAVATAALSTIQGILAASADARIANIDREIAAEQRRDGKSAESVAKIQALERKKEAAAKKSFEVQKKLMMAQAIISTASAVVGALGMQPAGPWNIPIAMMMGALGAAQLAIIAGTSYQSTSSPGMASATPPSTLSVGKRGDTVDLAKNNSNAGGEIGYLRGTRGYGNNASNYAVIGSAYGGRTPRGYGNTAYVVGEHGPETITPETPITVRPTNDNERSSVPINATFNVQALDAAGVEEILHGQRGNIIGMLREAANANGQTFLEDVNTAVYTKPNVSRL